MNNTQQPQPHGTGRLSSSWRAAYDSWIEPPSDGKPMTREKMYRIRDLTAGDIGCAYMDLAWHDDPLNGFVLTMPNRRTVHVDPWDRFSVSRASEKWHIYHSIDHSMSKGDQAELRLAPYFTTGIVRHAVKMAIHIEHTQHRDHNLVSAIY